MRDLVTHIQFSEQTTFCGRTDPHHLLRVVADYQHATCRTCLRAQATEFQRCALAQAVAFEECRRRWRQLELRPKVARAPQPPTTELEQDIFHMDKR